MAGKAKKLLVNIKLDSFKREQVWMNAQVNGRCKFNFMSCFGGVHK